MTPGTLDPAVAARGRTAHVFVIAGQLNLVAAELIAATLPAGDIVWIIDTIRHAGTSRQGDVFRSAIGKAGTFEVLRAFRRTYRTLRALRAAAAKVHAYIPHAYNSIANDLVFGLRADCVSLLPDGLLNYYDARIDRPAQYLHMLALAVVSRLLGGSYRPVAGDLIARSRIDYTDCHVFSTRGLTTAVGNVRLLAFPREDFEPVAGRTLFLDQPAELLRPAAREALGRQLSAALRDARELLYKPHPTQRSRNVADNDALVLQEVTVREPVERLVAQLKPDRVAGIYSSALITLKLMYPELPVVSIGMEHFIARNPRLATAREAMRALGIVIA